MILSVGNQNTDAFMVSGNTLNSTSPSGIPIHALDVILWLFLLLICAGLVKTSIYLYQDVYYSEDSDKVLRGMILGIFVSTICAIILLIKLTIKFVI